MQLPRLPLGKLAGTRPVIGGVLDAADSSVEWRTTDYVDAGDAPRPAAAYSISQSKVTCIHHNVDHCKIKAACWRTPVAAAADSNCMVRCCRFTSSIWIRTSQNAARRQWHGHATAGQSCIAVITSKSSEPLGCWNHAGRYRRGCAGAMLPNTDPCWSSVHTHG